MEGEEDAEERLHLNHGNAQPLTQALCLSFTRPLLITTDHNHNINWHSSFTSTSFDFNLRHVNWCGTIFENSNCGSDRWAKRMISLQYNWYEQCTCVSKGIEQLNSRIVYSYCSKCILNAGAMALELVLPTAHVAYTMQAIECVVVSSFSTF